MMVVGAALRHHIRHHSQRLSVLSTRSLLYISPKSNISLLDEARSSPAHSGVKRMLCVSATAFSSSDVYQHLHHEFRINNLSTAHQLIDHFRPEERALLLKLLNQKVEQDKELSLEDGSYHPEMFVDDNPTMAQIKQLFIINTIPFIGFGILDNMIMIMAGEYIDQTLGALLGISTMAAAALGNIISDVAGVGLAHQVEVLVTRLGFKHPELNAQQLTSKKLA
uniref:Transmembrane protein 65 n=1 Tax=Ditylenchus dipsaci TaxID=166011 RepID=A0A915DYW7_9BILA